MRYQVPQFVDIEDKIIGPFTLKQFLIYLVGVFVLIPVYLFSDLSLFITLALPVAGIAGAFAHLKVNGKPLSAVLTNGFFFLTKGQLYIWRRTNRPNPLALRDSQWEELLLAREAADADLTSLTKLAQTLDTGGNIVKSEDIEDPLTSDAI